MEHLERLTLEQFVDLYENKKFKINKKRKMFWYHLIKSNNLTCRATNKKVAYCSLDMEKDKSLHYNFYSEDGELFTIDHKLPKSRGGKDVIDNVQPMIAKS